jgi:hypothetical protein
MGRREDGGGGGYFSVEQEIHGGPAKAKSVWKNERYWR